jgi:hypothetical protein
MYTLFGWPTPGRLIGRPGVGHPQGIFGVFSYCQLVILFLNMVYLTVPELTWKKMTKRGMIQKKDK